VKPPTKCAVNQGTHGIGISGLTLAKMQEMATSHFLFLTMHATEEEKSRQQPTEYGVDLAFGGLSMQKHETSHFI